MKKKILFIIWSHSYGGGAEAQLTNLVNNLDKNKYEIDIIEYFHTNIKKENLASHINVLRAVNDKQKDSKIKRFLVNILIYLCPKIIKKIYIKGKYDLQISFNYLIPTFLLDKKTPSISWVHGSIWDIKSDRNPYLFKLQKKSFSNVNKIVAIAKETRKSIVTLYPEYKDKTTIIYNGYDFNKMINLSSEKVKTKKTNKFEFLYCNRFDENKNPLLLIEAAKLLKTKTNNFHINMLGKGNLEPKMKELIKKYKLEENISVVGFVSNPYPYIKNTDIMCLTSKTEGFSTVIIEGLNFGKPYISTDGGVTEEIKEYECGIVSNTAEEISKAMLKIIENKEIYRKLSLNCKKVALKYSLKNQVKETEKLIDKLLK